MTNKKQVSLDKELFLSEIMGAKVFVEKTLIGKLEDFVISETGKLPEVTHIYVLRKYGRPPLTIPWSLVSNWTTKDIKINSCELNNFLNNASEEKILLKDYILDKKVLDVEGREVEVVYDIKLIEVNSKLLVSEVDLSKFGRLRRMGLKGLASLFYKNEDISDQIISWTYIQPLPEQIGSFKGNIKLNVLKEKLSDMHPVDLADILEELEPEQRIDIIENLDIEHASDTLEEIDPNVQRDIVIALTKEKAAKLINDMTPAQAADILAVLPASERDIIVSMLDAENQEKVKANLEQQEENIINFTTLSFLTFSPKQTVGEALKIYRKTAKDSDVITYLYIVDDGKLTGVVDIKEVLMAEDSFLLLDIMTDIIISLNEDDNLSEAIDMFKRYDLRAIPVVNEDDKILGVLTSRDTLNLKHRSLE